MIQSWGLGTFRWDNEDTKEDEILRWILRKQGSGVFRSIFSGVIDPIREIITQKLPQLLEEKITVSNVWQHIEQVVSEVEQILKPNLKKKYLRDKILPSVSYRTYIYWIVEKLKSIGYT